MDVSSEIKIVLGCYDSTPHPFHYRWIDDTWILSDINPRHPHIVKIDARNIPYREVSAIYASHIIEHIDPEYIEAMFKHWHSVLKEGGKVIINVPDMEWMSQELIILEDGNEGTSSCFNSIDKLMEGFYGNPNDTTFDKHRWGFTKTTLHKYLEKAGFKNIKVVQEYEAHEMGCLIAEAIK